MERAYGIVEKKWGSRPQADERRGSRIPAAPGGQRIGSRLPGDRVVPGDSSGRRQVLVRPRREVVPYVAAQRIRCQRAARVRVKRRDGNSKFGRQIVLSEKIVSQYDRLHL